MDPSIAWWIWPLALFGVCLLMGMLAVPAGIGGGSLFVPIVGSFFPFHLDFVRGAGLMVALASALAAAPTLMRGGLASLRLAMPLALLGSISAVAGAFIGLALPVQVVQTALGLLVLAIVLVMWRSKASTLDTPSEPDAWARALTLHGIYTDPNSGRAVPWGARRTPLGLLAFLCIGMLAGVFGLGAGWANVPALNLLMGVPLKLSAGTSGLILSLVDSSAAWVYLNQGAILPLLVVPSVLGVMLGAKIGAGLLQRWDAQLIRQLVIGTLLFAGLRALLKGLGVWP
ncbi:MAG: sulfite exporter TauE/SafE family protein [Aquabacterium sp.]